MPEDKPVITDKRGGGVKEWYLNYVTQLRDDLDDSTVDTNIISHYLGAVCARRFASSRESSHTQLSERERERDTEKRNRMRWDASETRDKKAESTHLYKLEKYEAGCSHIWITVEDWLCSQVFYILKPASYTHQWAADKRLNFMCACVTSRVSTPNWQDTLNASLSYVLFGFKLTYKSKPLSLNHMRATPSMHFVVKMILMGWNKWPINNSCVFNVEYIVLYEFERLVINVPNLLSSI